MTVSETAGRNIVVILVFSVLISGCGSWFYMGQHPSVDYRSAKGHLSEESRRSINSLRIVTDPTPPTLSVGGDYGTPTPTTGEGVRQGMAAGTVVTGEMLAEDPRTLILVPLVLPVALIAGGIAGAAGAKIEKELAKFREGLADELVNQGDTPVPAEALTEQLGQLVSTTTDIKIANETADAELEMVFEKISIDTQDEDAIITAVARATLRDPDDGSRIFARVERYSERNKLRRWAADDNAMWRDYTVRAREFLAAEIVADMFETVHLRHVLRPMETKSFSGGWSARFRDKSTTLAWELFLLGGDPYFDDVDKDRIRFDLRILDQDRIIYEVRGIEGNEHAVTEPLPTCRTLRWSVRPRYLVDGHQRAGEWMEYRSGFDKFWNNEAIETYPETPAYGQYFATVRSRCAS